MTARKKYPLPYRMYRRMRYLCYVGKLRKKERKAAEKVERQAQREARRAARQQRKLDRDADRKKKHQERIREKAIRDEIIASHQEFRLQHAGRHDREKEEERQKRAADKRFRKYRRRRLLRFFVRSCYRSFVYDIKRLNPANLPMLVKYLRSQRQGVNEFLIITLHSTLLFTAAYFLIFLLGLMASAVSGIFFGYSSVVYHNEVLWLVKPEEWFGDSVKMIYSSGPVLSGIIAVFLAIWFSYIRTGSGLGKLFLLWTFMHGFNAFFGALLIGSLFDRGIGYAIIWSYISDTEKVIYTIISITSLLLLGVFTTRSFLISANTYYNKLEKHKQRRFVWAQVIMPFIMGNAIIAMVMIPDVVLYDMTVSATLGLAIIPVAFGYRFAPALYFEEEHKNIRLRIMTLILSLVFIVVYRIVLGMGIMMG